MIANNHIHVLICREFITGSYSNGILLILRLATTGRQANTIEPRCMYDDLELQQQNKNESMVSLVSRRYMRVANGSLVVCHYGASFPPR